METISDIVAEMRAKTAKSKDLAWYDAKKWAELCNRIEMAALHQRVKDMDEAYNDGYGEAEFDSEMVTKCNQPVTDCHGLNAAKMREALENSNGLIEELVLLGEWHESAREQIEENYAALYAPPRNCDVGTVDEQEERFHAFCNRHTNEDAQHCNDCPINNMQTEADCALVWAQMPYGANEKGHDDGDRNK
jgi:hypothetical protein